MVEVSASPAAAVSWRPPWSAMGHKGDIVLSPLVPAAGVIRPAIARPTVGVTLTECFVGIPLLRCGVMYSGTPTRDPEEIAAVLERARAVAIDYYRLTRKPLGITGEIGEYEASRLLGLKLSAAREAGYDAIDHTGHRYQIKARWINEDGLRKSQRLGSIKLTHPWDSVLLVILDMEFRAIGIWQAEREAIAVAIAAPGGKARNERGSLTVSKFKSIGREIWPPLPPHPPCGG
jgi:hypothetical protein